MTTVFDSSNGCTYGVVEMGECERHGRYPNIIRQRFGKGCYGFSSLNLGCPMCKREASDRKIYGAISIPRRFIGKTFENYQPDENSQRVYDFFRDYADHLQDRIDAGTSVILTGRPGTGKTHLACALLFEAKKKGYSAFFINIRKLFRAVRDTWREGAAESESQVIDRYVDLDLLVIDEVGVQAKSENEQCILYDILNGRYENAKPTIILSNETLPGIKQIISERAYDRLREGGGKAFDCSWESYRGKAELADDKPVSIQNIFEFYEVDDSPDQESEKVDPFADRWQDGKLMPAHIQPAGEAA